MSMAVAISHPVLCERCRRSIVVAVSNLHPPCFRHVEEQVECPEIQERSGKGEGRLLLMMCGALKRSLEVDCESAKVEAVDRDGEWLVACRTPGDPSALHSAGEARRLSEVWQAHGQTKLAAQLRAAAAKVERRKSGRVGAIVGVCVMVVVTAGIWLLLVREPTRVAIQMPPPAQAPVETADAIPANAAPAALATAPSTPVAAIAPAAAIDAAPAASQIASSEPAQPPPDETPADAVARPPAPAAQPAASPTTDAVPVSDPALRVPDLVSIPGGTFAMGGTGDPSELPIHRVTIKPFALSKFPITVREWKECVAAKACAYLPEGQDDAPVTNVSFSDAQEYLTWLSQVTQKTFRLPSEAEWEYAARAGMTTKYWWGDQIRAGVANCKGCNEPSDAAQPVMVGSFQANPFGLFDMGGGVDQWVADCWHKSYQGAPVDGSAWTDGECPSRVMRSGSWKNDPSYARAASRDHYDARVRYPTHGFRVALSLDSVSRR
jgi:formylglycine-generating enzyme required for sulfatase activity